ncbi:MAG TPA: hypothetical protein PKB15_08585 [Acidimicrobiia bacterium]|nr:hypothetical protein [Acidimicrobiia bacterium]
MLVASLSIVSCSSGDGKPSRAEYKAALEKMYGLYAAPNGDNKDQNKLIDCIVDNTYGELPSRAIKFFTEDKYKDLDDEGEIKDKKVENDLNTVGDEATACEDKYPDPDTPIKSGAKTVLRTAMAAASDVKTQNMDGDFSDISVYTLAKADPDLQFVSTPLGVDAKNNSVAVLVVSSEQIVMQSRENLLGTCLFVELNVNSAIRYGSSIVGPKNTCGTVPDPVSGSDYVSRQNPGWTTKADK